MWDRQAKLKPQPDPIPGGPATRRISPNTRNFYHKPPRMLLQRTDEMGADDIFHVVLMGCAGVELPLICGTWLRMAMRLARPATSLNGESNVVTSFRGQWFVYLEVLRTPVGSCEPGWSGSKASTPKISPNTRSSYHKPPRMLLQRTDEMGADDIFHVVLINCAGVKLPLICGTWLRMAMRLARPATSLNGESNVVTSFRGQWFVYLEVLRTTVGSCEPGWSESKAWTPKISPNTRSSYHKPPRMLLQRTDEMGADDIFHVVLMGCAGVKLPLICGTWLRMAMRLARPATSLNGESNVVTSFRGQWFVYLEVLRTPVGSCEPGWSGSKASTPKISPNTRSSYHKPPRMLLQRTDEMGADDIFHVVLMGCAGVKLPLICGTWLRLARPATSLNGESNVVTSFRGQWFVYLEVLRTPAGSCEPGWSGSKASTPKISPNTRSSYHKPLLQRWILTVACSGSGCGPHRKAFAPVRCLNEPAHGLIEGFLWKEATKPPKKTDGNGSALDNSFALLDTRVARLTNECTESAGLRVRSHRA